MDPSWLVRQLSFDQAIDEYGACPDRDWRWQLLFDAFTAGDKLWEYSTPPEYWQRQGGQAGVVLLRAGQLVQQVITRVS